MKNSKKIIAVLVAVLLAVVGVFAACSKTDDGKDDEKAMKRYEYSVEVAKKLIEE